MSSMPSLELARIVVPFGWTSSTHAYRATEIGSCCSTQAMGHEKLNLFSDHSDINEKDAFSFSAQSQCDNQ